MSECVGVVVRPKSSVRPISSSGCFSTVILGWQQTLVSCWWSRQLCCLDAHWCGVLWCSTVFVCVMTSQAAFKSAAVRGRATRTAALTCTIARGLTRHSLLHLVTFSSSAMRTLERLSNDEVPRPRGCPIEVRTSGGLEHDAANACGLWCLVRAHTFGRIPPQSCPSPMLKCVSCPSAHQHQETHRVFGTKIDFFVLQKGRLSFGPPLCGEGVATIAHWRWDNVVFADSRWLSVVFYYQGRIFEQLLPNENRFCVLSPSPTYATTMAETKKNSYF